MTQVILAIVFAFTAGIFLMISIYEDNASEMCDKGKVIFFTFLAIICIVTTIALTAIGISKFQNGPIKTKGAPVVDTLVNVKNRVADTTYHYWFNGAGDENGNNN